MNLLSFRLIRKLSLNRSNLCLQLKHLILQSDSFHIRLANRVLDKIHRDNPRTQLRQPLAQPRLIFPSPALHHPQRYRVMSLMPHLLSHHAPFRAALRQRFTSSSVGAFSRMV